ncbi:Eco57I restriction-modification methylase domain-containing protein [Burkholderia ubonensis]|uniref:Eco57I restriction-modification methylase domain-containing protein n=1 Tax=Burkholderia ubonensis TaxID=101571 RepID=UPI0008FE3A81|nr:DNA methyltransferase [Burkholderia ubonensis]
MSHAKSNVAFLQAHAKVCDLIDRFARYAKSKYLLPSYQEAEARKDFIDPLLKAIGWDVDHEHQHNPYEQEVKVESGLIVHNARAQKRADYAFYLAPNFQDVRFYVEAKKPSIDLDNSVDAHFQTLRYGYGAGTPLSLLTDFERIIVLDCRRLPHPDSALRQVYKKWHYSEFRDAGKFAEFYWLFSREAHADGSYQRRVEELPKPRGGAKQRGLFKGGYQPVDESFLLELSAYRETLAKAFKKANILLGSAELTELVQRALDRLVFMRFLEDKQIETEVRVSNLGKSKSAWTDFQIASRRLDNIYNGIVFKPLPTLDDANFEVDDEVFGDICERMAAENSPYNFDAIPIHIFGSIYERFLGSVIRATEKQVKVEEKPEVRKAGGVYYTPEYIVRYIVAQTVGKVIAGKTPEKIEQMRFADIACGSGSFLLGIYDELLRYHVIWYNQPGRDKQAKKAGCVLTEDGRWQLSLAQRRNILQNNIYGVDLDRQAVEVAQLSLFLKLLENERATSKHQYLLDFARNANMKKLLPDLSSNIVCGNSLIGWDIAGMAKLSPEDEAQINPLDFETEFPNVFRGGGFDAIIGNPPYEVVEKERSQASWPHQTFIDAINSSNFYDSALGGKLNMYRFFVVRTIKLLKSGGYTGLIVPLSLLADISCAKTRSFLIEQLRPVRVDCFPQKDNAIRRIFREAKLSTMIYTGHVCNKTKSDVDINLNVYPWNSFDDEPKCSNLKIKEIRLLDPENCPIPLVSNEQWSLAKKIHSGAGIVRLEDIPGVKVTRGEINQTIYRDYITENQGDARLVKGVEIAQYKVRSKLSQGHQEWLNETAYLEDYKARATTNQRRIATQRITGVDEKLRIVATIIDPPAYFADSTNSIFVSKEAGVKINYILAVLNSKLMQWRFKLTSTNNNVGTNELKSLPIFSPKSNPQFIKCHDAIVDKVDALILAKQQESSTSGHAAEIAARKCAALSRQIDEVIYELYGLTAEEIKLVEG